MLDKYSASSAFSTSTPSTTHATDSGWDGPEEERTALSGTAVAVPAMDDMPPKVVTERRAQLRHRSVMRVARISSKVHRVEALGVVRNVSENGMMIDAYRGFFAVGEPIKVSLLDGDRVDGKVVWKDGTTIGVQFSSEIAVDHLLAKPRVFDDGTRVRPLRITLHRRANIRIGGTLADIEICDISQRGAKVRFDKSLAIDSRAQISMSNLRPICGSVKWQLERLIGLEFHRTLTVEELSTWVSDNT